MRDCLIHAGSKLTKLLADHLHHEPPVHGIGLDVLALDPGRLYLGRLRSALQVRDVEACLQEQLLDQFNDRLLAAAAAAVPKGTHQATGSQAQEAAARLRPLLAALSTSGAAGPKLTPRMVMSVPPPRSQPAVLLPLSVQPLTEYTMAGAYDR